MDTLLLVILALAAGLVIGWLGHVAFTAQLRRDRDTAADQRLQATQQAVAPLHQALAEFRDKLAGLEKDRAVLATELTGQVRLVRETGEQVRRETRQLVAALRQPHVRGRWGELQLRRVVELAGMVDHCDFVEQEAGTTDDGRIRPDLKVLLAGGKFVYVDAKVPLAAFLDAQEAATDADRDHALARFAGHVRHHIDQLAGKKYWAADESTPDFTVLFIPSEALAGTALDQAPDLIEYAAARRIVIATPTTLIALLWSVAHAWKQAALADSARDIAALGKELYGRLTTMAGHVDKLGRGLLASVRSYNDFVGSLESRVLVTARRFDALQVADGQLDSPARVDLGPRTLAA
jgi:DNA recombination protein RmuC